MMYAKEVLGRALERLRSDARPGKRRVSDCHPPARPLHWMSRVHEALHWRTRMHPDFRSYFHFTGKSRFEKSVNSLLGLLQGIALDGQVTSGEVAILRAWIADHQDVVNRHPYSELIPPLAAAVADGVMSTDEREDLTWLCNRLRSTEFFDMVTADLQRLHALVGGIAADGQITPDEMRGLSDWLSEHEHLKTCWPYDERGAHDEGPR